MTRVYLRDLKAGKTFYQVVIAVSASGLKTASEVRTVQCLSVARRNSADRQVQGELPTWEVQVSIGNAPVRVFEAYRIGVLGRTEVPRWPGEKGLSLGPALFVTRGAATRFRKAFLTVHQPEQEQLDEVRLAHIWNQVEDAHDMDMFDEPDGCHQDHAGAKRPLMFTDVAYAQSTPVMPAAELSKELNFGSGQLLEGSAIRAH